MVSARLPSEKDRIFQLRSKFCGRDGTPLPKVSIQNHFWIPKRNVYKVEILMSNFDLENQKKRTNKTKTTIPMSITMGIILTFSIS